MLINKYKRVKRLWCAILAAMLMACALSGCQSRGNAGQEPESAPSEPSSQSEQTEQAVEVPTPTELPDFSEDVAEVYEKNTDTVGWLQVPGTDIDDAVLHKPEDETNKYYERKDINQQYYFYGVYYADCTSAFGEGTREDLGVNTCIYGHTISDDPNSAKYEIKFGQLHDFRDPERAKELPYLYFSTAKETLAFEVFAVFTANCDNTSLPYNRNLPADEFVTVIKEQVLPRSIYNYDVEITEEDKFLTLSTCIYSLPDGTTLPTESWIRYGIMAKLVPPDTQLKETAEFEPNPNPVIDQDGAWPD